MRPTSTPPCGAGLNAIRASTSTSPRPPGSTWSSACSPISPVVVCVGDAFAVSPNLNQRSDATLTTATPLPTLTTATPLPNRSFGPKGPTPSFENILRPLENPKKQSDGGGRLNPSRFLFRLAFLSWPWRWYDVSLCFCKIPEFSGSYVDRVYSVRRYAARSLQCSRPSYRSGRPPTTALQTSSSRTSASPISA